jgi:hypothetical protein
MDASLVVAQASAPSAGAPAISPRLIRLTKPQDSQAVTVPLDGGRAQLDFSPIANENVTLVHIGDKLVVLFDNHATITVAPAFGADGKLLPDITFELAPDRIVDGTEFATLYPITTDQSVLPAAVFATPSSGANFFDIPEVVPLGPAPHPLALHEPADLHLSHGVTPVQITHIDIIHHPHLPAGDEVMRMMLDATQSHAHV